MRIFIKSSAWLFLAWGELVTKDSWSLVTADYMPVYASHLAFIILVLHILWSRHCDYPQFTDKEPRDEHSGNLSKIPELRSDGSRIWAQVFSLTDEAPSCKLSVIEQVSFLGNGLTNLYQSHQPVFKKQELLLFWEGAETLYLLCFGLMKPHPGGFSQFQSGYTLFAFSAFRWEARISLWSDSSSSEWRFLSQGLL